MPSPTTAAAPILRLDHISKTFGGRRVLDDVAFEVRAGEVHALLGQNGSGKSTLIKILSAYHAPDDAGAQLEIRGRGVALPLAAEEPARLGFSFVHQDLALVQALTVAESLLVGRYRTGFGWRIPWRRERGRVRTLLDSFGVEVDCDARIGDLSEVDRARLAIARALDRLGDTECPLLVLDEPTAYLPRDGVDRLFDAIREVRARGVGVVLVTHRLDEAKSIADRVTVLRDGRVVETAAAADLSQSQLIERIVGSTLDKLYPTPDSDVGEVGLAARDVTGRGVAGVSFDLRRGEILGATGLLGTGFEELVHLMFGAAAAEAGEIEVDGQCYELPSFSPRRAIKAGMALIPGDRARNGAAGSATVTENVTLVSLQRHWRTMVLRRRAERRAAQALLGEYQVTPPVPELAFATLSGGNQQKALIGKWFTTKPSVLLLHDPTRGVDVGAKRQVFQRIREAADAGACVLIASPEYADLAHLCDRVLVLRHGRVVTQLAGTNLSEDRIVQHCYASGEDTA